MADGLGIYGGTDLRSHGATEERIYGATDLRRNGCQKTFRMSRGLVPAIRRLLIHYIVPVLSPSAGISDEDDGATWDTANGRNPLQ